MRKLFAPLAWLLRHPIQGAIIVGVFFAVLFGAISFPREERIETAVADWLPANASDDEAVVSDLMSSLEEARRGDGADLITISEDRFRELNLPIAHAFPVIARNGNDFLIRYLGKESQGEAKLYLAERKVSAGPWWDPDRLLYRALEAKTDQFGTVLNLTFERDWQGLLALLFLDIVIGTIYGTITGLILGVLNMKGLEPPGQPRLQERRLKDNLLPSARPTELP